MKIPHDVEMIWWEIWYGASARFHAICHKLRHPSHKLHWRYNPDEFCSGDIYCETCPLCYWCRANQWNNALGTWLCAKLGHHWNDGTGWQKNVGWDDVKDEPIYEPLPPQRPTCNRCHAEKPDWP